MVSQLMTQYQDQNRRDMLQDKTTSFKLKTVDLMFNISAQHTRNLDGILRVKEERQTKRCCMMTYPYNSGFRGSYIISCRLVTSVL